MLGPFGDYTLLRRIGAGGMAEVFLARRDRGAGSPKVAVLKRVLPHLRSDATVVELFVNEARITARLAAPNIVRVFEAGRVDDRDFIAMELVLGADLARLAERCAPCPADALGLGAIIRLAADVCAGLHAAHEARDEHGAALELVHGDVNPHNVRVTHDGVAKLIDFGVASANACASPAAASPRGTYAYMAPEQLRGEPFDRRADVFAAAVVLWELLAGRRLFQRGANYLTLAAVVEDAAPRLAPQLGERAAALDVPLARALAKDPSRRHESCAELAATLLELADAQGWDATREGCAGAVRHLFEEPLARLAGELARAGAASVDDWLCALADDVDLAWLLDG